MPVISSIRDQDVDKEHAWPAARALLTGLTDIDHTKPNV